jgi:hypothetical protein
MDRQPRRYLDEPYLSQKLAIEAAQAHLKVLAADESLPPRMRASCGQMYIRLGQLARALARQGARDRRQAQPGPDDQP